MHEQLHTSDPDVEDIVEKFRRLSPEHQSIFMAFLRDLAKNPDTPLPSFSPQGLRH